MKVNVSVDLVGFTFLLFLLLTLGRSWILQPFIHHFQLTTCLSLLLVNYSDFSARFLTSFHELSVATCGFKMLQLTQVGGRCTAYCSW